MVPSRRYGIAGDAGYQTIQGEGNEIRYKSHHDYAGDCVSDNAVNTNESTAMNLGITFGSLSDFSKSNASPNICFINCNASDALDCHNLGLGAGNSQLLHVGGGYGLGESGVRNDSSCCETFLVSFDSDWISVRYSGVQRSNGNRRQIGGCI